MGLAEAGFAMKKRLREYWYYAARRVYDNTTVEVDDGSAWKPEVDRATATAPHQLRSNLGKSVEALPRPRTTKIVRALFQQVGAPYPLNSFRRTATFKPHLLAPCTYIIRLHHGSAARFKVRTEGERETTSDRPQGQQDKPMEYCR